MGARSSPKEHIGLDRSGDHGCGEARLRLAIDQCAVATDGATVNTTEAASIGIPSATSSKPGSDGCDLAGTMHGATGKLAPPRRVQQMEVLHRPPTRKAAAEPSNARCHFCQRRLLVEEAHWQAR